MMKVQSFYIAAIVSFAAALSGCVSYGNTHALITPVGVAGYHTFKPDVVDPNAPRDIRLSQQRAALERVASTNAPTESDDDSTNDEI